MTKNNLSKCLAWFLQQNNHFNKSLDYLVALLPDTSSEIIFSDIEDEEMARLQLVPQSVTKPRLLAQSKNADVPPTPTPSRSPLEQSETMGIASHKTRQATPRTTVLAPRTPASTHDGGIFDIDDLEDLLDEDPEDITTSSYGDFGTPEVLWNEQAAVRVEPTLQNRGRKRKSEDYLRGSTSPKISRRIKSPTAAVIPKIATAARHRKLSPGDPRDIRSSAGRNSDAMRPSYRPYDEYSDSQSTIKQDFKKSISTYDTSTSQTRNDGVARNYVIPNISHADEYTSSPDAKSHHRSGDALWRSPRNPDTGSDINISEVNRVDASPFPKPIRSNSRVANDTSYAESMTSRHVVQSQRAILSRHSPPSSDSSHSTKVKLTAREKQTINDFISVPVEKCDQLLKRLETSRKETSARMARQLYENDEVSPDMKEKMREIKDRMSALQEITKIRSNYEQLGARRESLMHKLQEMLVEDHDFDDSVGGSECNLVMSEIRNLKPQIDDVEKVLHALILRVGWSDDHDLPVETPQQDVQSSQDTPTTRRVLVASTQHPKVQSVLSSNSGPQSLPHVQSLAQSVAHTPIVQRNYQTTANVRPLQEIQDQYVYSNGIRGALPPANRSARNHDQIDEFEDVFDDEDDMIDAAQAFEEDLAVQRTNVNTGRTPRSALVEMSENVRRPPDIIPTVIPLKQYPWSKDVHTTLRKRFHLEGFRHNQLEAINATLSGKDAFVLMPTGGGKSLCYQLPSVILTGRTHGITVVVSPLLSLMQDQVDHLQKLRIQAFMINGESTREHKNYIYQALQDHQPERFVQLLYVTPELLGKSAMMTQKFADLHKRKKLARLVIDEAHCVSQWGHDFRPDYKALGGIRAQFHGVPVMALTATATENVKLDVIHNLRMDGCDVFTQSFNRPNLSYEVRPKGKGKDALADIAEVITKHHDGQSGIVYCLSRNNCESVAQQLQKDYAVSATHYHAGLDSETRTNVQKQWQAGRYKVIVATIAFGMGIDKSDVRFVIHYTIPKSLEGYYQETGRAGRDGRQSSCYLYYGFGDTTSLRRLIDDSKDTDWEQKDRQKQMLRNVVQFCENKSDCRRVQVLAYFNEHFDRAKCNNTCDNCQSDSVFVDEDFSEHAENMINLVQKIEQHDVTLLQCVDIYRGMKAKKFADSGHNRLEEYGMGSELDRNDIERCFYRLVSEDALEMYHKMNMSKFPVAYIKLGPNFEVFRSRLRPLRMQVRVSPRGKMREKKGGKGKHTADLHAIDLPASTNVSSPVEARKSNKKRLVRRNETRILEENDEESDDGFAPILEVGRPQKAKRSSIGPPITTDERFAQLSDAHKSVLEIFIDDARKKIREIGVNRNLRQRAISDTILREIGMAFPLSETDLRATKGMTEEKMKHFGPSLLRLIRTSHANYLAMTALIGDQRPNTAAPRTVLEISDDEADSRTNDFAEENFFSDDEDGDFEPEGLENSRFFSAVPSRDGARQAVPSHASSSPRKQNTAQRTASQSRSSGSSSYRRGSSHIRGRGGKTSVGRIIKRKSSGSRAGSSGGKKSANSETKRAAKGSQGSRGIQASLIGMMPV